MGGVRRKKPQVYPILKSLSLDSINSLFAIFSGNISSGLNFFFIPQLTTVVEKNPG